MPGLLEEQGSQQNEANTQRAPKPPSEAGASTSTSSLPKGIVLGKDGKPCRTCTSSAAWMAMMKQSTKQPVTSKSLDTPAPAPATSEPSDCPPDVEQLGNASWTLLHSLTASYPEQPSPSHQAKTSTFLHLFSQLYPCWVCAEDFQNWMVDPQNDPEKSGALKSQEGFGRWMCRAHNAVNVKLGKEEFNCDLWRERWKDGWKDGRCG